MAALKLASAALAMMVGAPASAQSVTPWRPFVVEASRRFGIPEPWIEQVMRAESSGQTMLAGQPIRSRAGAIGLMQVMPATWAAMRRALGLGINPDDPRDNILAGTFYLRLMYDRFGYPGLFAAYNAGPARYVTALATGRSLPAETVAYLRKVDRPIAAPASHKPAETLFAIMPQAAPGAAKASGDRGLVLLFAVKNDGP